MLSTLIYGCRAATIESHCCRSGLASRVIYVETAANGMATVVAVLQIARSEDGSELCDIVIDL